MGADIAGTAGDEDRIGHGWIDRLPQSPHGGYMKKAGHLAPGLHGRTLQRQRYAAFGVAPFSAGGASGRSTSSTSAIGALSPTRKPNLRIRKYPPGRALYRGPSSSKSFVTTWRSRKRLNARRRLASVG